MDTVKMGSIYVGFGPMEIGHPYIDSFLIGSTAPGKAIVWNKVGDRLIAAEPVVTDVSWPEIDETGFISGRPVCIDGRFFICRSLKLGAIRDGENEWKEVLEESGNDSDETWNWSKGYFWGQETSELYPDEKVLCGFNLSTYWGAANPHRFKGIGFRPVLEEILNGVLVSDALLGKDVALFGPNGQVSGRLEELTEYDMTLKADSFDEKLVQYNSWTTLRDGYITADRQAVTCAQVILKH